MERDQWEDRLWVCFFTPFKSKKSKGQRVRGDFQAFLPVGEPLSAELLLAGLGSCWPLPTSPGNLHTHMELPGCQPLITQFLCTKPYKPPTKQRNLEPSGELDGGGWRMRPIPLISPWTSRSLVADLCSEKLASSWRDSSARAHTNSLSRTPTLRLWPTFSTPGRYVETGPCTASTFPALPAPRLTRAPAPSLGALQRDTSPSGLLTSHRQLLAGTGADRGGRGGEPAPKLRLMVGPLHPTQKRELAAFVLSKSKGELILPLKWPTCTRSFLSQCPLPPPPPGCALDHCPVAQHPGLRVKEEWEKGGLEEKSGRRLARRVPSGLLQKGGELQSPVAFLPFAAKPTS